MPSTAIPTDIGSAGKAPTKSVSATALRSTPPSFTGTSASLVLHSGSGLTAQEVLPASGGGAGAGPDSLEVKISNLDESTRRRRAFTATLATAAEADFVGDAGLQAILAGTVDPVTGSAMSPVSSGASVFVRRGTYGLGAFTSWAGKISLFGEASGDASDPLMTLPIIEYEQAGDMAPSATAIGGFNILERVKLTSTSTGRWTFGQTSGASSSLRRATDVYFDSGLLLSDPQYEMTFTDCVSLFKAGCPVTSNYNLEITGSPLQGQIVYRGCRFVGVSPNAASPAAGAVVYIHDIPLVSTRVAETIVFEACHFLATGVEALLEIENSYTNIIFRNCYFSCGTRGATARPLFVGLNSIGVVFDNCTAVTEGPVMDFTSCGCVIDGFEIWPLSSTDSTTNPTFYSFSGYKDVFADEESKWVDIRHMDITVDPRSDSTGPCVLIGDYVRGGTLRIAQTGQAWATGPLLRILKNLSGTGGHWNVASTFDHILIDCGGETLGGVADPLVEITGGPANEYENTHALFIGSLNILNMENVDDRVIVTISNSTKIGDLTFEAGLNNSSDNASPLLTITGNNVDIGNLEVDSTGSNIRMASGTPVFLITGDRCVIRSGFYHKDTTLGDSTTSIFNISGDYCKLLGFNCVIDNASVVFSEAMVYVRADFFSLEGCTLFIGSTTTATFFDLDGVGACIDKNLFLGGSTSIAYANIAGSDHAINGNRFLSTGGTPFINVTASNVAPAVISDTNVFGSSAPVNKPVT